MLQIKDIANNNTSNEGYSKQQYIFSQIVHYLLQYFTGLHL